MQNKKNIVSSWAKLGLLPNISGASFLNTMASSMSGLSSNLMPISIQVASSTIGLDLVAVKPMQSPDAPWRKSDKQQLKEDRMNKIRKLEGKEPNIVLPNDAGGGNLLFLDYVYGGNSGSTQKKYIPKPKRSKNNKKSK